MKVLIIPGSVRPNSVGNGLISQVEAELRRHPSAEVEVATPEDVSLPLFDANASPAAGAEIIHESVKRWSKKVAAADAYVLMAPEYNDSVSAVQKNYIDWLYQEWNGKKAAIVNYNHYDKKSSAEALMNILQSVKVEVVEPVAYLRFGQDINGAGEVLDLTALQQKLNATVTALLDQ